MKVSIAVVRLYLKTSKKLSDGTSPIMLKCSFHGSYEKSTHYSCLPKHWDKRSECVKRGCMNFASVNKEIRRMKEEAIRVRDSYIEKGGWYTAKMVLSPLVDESPKVSLEVGDVCERYIEEKRLSANTSKTLRLVVRSLSQYAAKTISVCEITEKFAKGYAAYLDGRVSEGTVRLYLSKVGALCHYAMDEGWMSEYPFSRWKYHKVYNESKSNLYVHSKSVGVLFDVFLDEVIERHGSGWCYRDGMEKRMLDTKDRLYALYLYVMGVWMNGLAPVDISLLRKSDIGVVEIGGKDYYRIDSSRHKTHVRYRIRLEKNTLLGNVLMRTPLMFHDGDYLLPTLEGFHGKDVLKRVNNVYSRHRENLRRWFSKVNEEIARRNVTDGGRIPLIDLSCGFYSYRHTAVMMEVEKGVKWTAIATKFGKSVRTLHEYISELSEECDLV